MEPHLPVQGEPSSMAKVTAKCAKLPLKTYTRFPRRQLPMVFQETYGNIYPDTRDDILGGPVKTIKYDAIVLENPHIRVTILPELGGKIWSVYDKHAKRETLHVPDCVKPGLIFLRGAWIAGGMELNFPIGHHADTMFPVPVRIEEQGPQQAVVVIERNCRRTGMRMETRVTLRADEACFDLAMTVSNPTPVSQRWYQWTNVGVTASKDWRFFSKGNLYTGGMGMEAYPVDNSGKDISWYRNRPVAGDNFMVGVREDYFGCYDFGKEHGLAHWAPWQQVPGKKYFTWGSTARTYDSGSIFNNTGDDYLEIQTGPMETQLHFAMLAPGQTQSFASTWMPYRQIGGLEWACRSLLFNVRNGQAWVYATTSVDAEIVINGRKNRVHLAPGEVTKLRARVQDGDSIEIFVNGKKERAFSYPLKGRMEPNAGKRSLKEQKLFTAAWANKVPDNAAGALAVARQMVKLELASRAVDAYRKAIALKPKLFDARLELADTLMRMGDSASAEEELTKWLRTKKAAVKAAGKAELTTARGHVKTIGQAVEMFTRLTDAKQAFMAPVLTQPLGPKRLLALAERLAGYGAFELAAGLYKELLKIDAKNPRVHYGQAMYLWHVKKTPAKAVEFADKALRLRPGDRDLLIELCPLYAQAGLHERVIEEIGKASPAVRKLPILQKLLVPAYFQTGRFAKCWKSLNSARLYPWEGEVAPTVAYIECALALTEEALRKGDLTAARNYVDMAADPSKNPMLGVLRYPSGNERVHFWRGLVALHEGKRREAEKIWRQVVEPAMKIRSRPLDISEWHLPPVLEDDYMLAMCAAGLRDAKAFRHCVRLFERLRDDWIKKSNEQRPAPVDLLNGLVAELHGRFGAAAKAFERHIAKAADKQVARMHLAAVKAGRMRGAALPVCRAGEKRAISKTAGA